MDIAEDLLIDAEAGSYHDGGHNSDRQFDLAVDGAETFVVEALQELRGQVEHGRYARQRGRWSAIGLCECWRWRKLQEGQEGAYVIVGGRQGQVVLEFHGERKAGVVIESADGHQGPPGHPERRHGSWAAGPERPRRHRPAEPAGAQKGRPRLAGRDVFDGYRGLERQILIAHCDSNENKGRPEGPGMGPAAEAEHPKTVEAGRRW